MLIDKSHRGWIVATLILLAISTALYVLYARQEPNGPTGGSWPGMAFGIVGSALMIFAGLLSVRKKIPWWRSLGTAQFWLRAHIWLGLLSVPLILFHSGFEFGGLLEQILLLLLAFVVISGILGVVLQIYLPGVMKMSISAESMYEEIPSTCLSLRRTADKVVQDICGLPIQSPDPALVSSAAAPKAQGDDVPALKDFYLQNLRPFLAADYGEIPRLPESARQMFIQGKAAVRFEQIRSILPADVHAAVDQLAGICDERRQLIHQQRLHHTLHGWLFVHVPVSVALLVLGILHVITALYY